MNNLNYHCRVFIRVFQGKKMPPLFFPLLDSFHFCLISFMCCIGCFLAIWISFLEQWDVWGLRGQLKNTALVVHSVTWHWLMRVRTWAEFDRERRGNWRTWGHQKEEGKEMTERRLERCQWLCAVRGNSERRKSHHSGPSTARDPTELERPLGPRERPNSDSGALQRRSHLSPGLSCTSRLAVST